ncbi:MAG: TonB-dependent receptor domain-containing protein, partial [Candidatus Acidiferrales bacterium]
YTNGIEFSVNGSRPRANNFLIDGQDDNDYQITGQAYQPTNIGAIQEVTILTNAYSAEFGRGGGSVTNYIYKSGTNNFHGDLWEINRNSALAAIPAQDAVANTISSNPHENENTFGFDVGGPIKKDKLFFFGTAQWDRERLSATGPVFTLPTAAGIETLKTAFPNNANVNLFLQAIGNLVSPGLNGLISIPTGMSGACPCVDAANFQTQNVQTAGNSVDWNIRMDWHMTDRDTLTGSFIRDTAKLSPDNFANPNALPGFQTEQEGPSEIARAQWLHTFSSRAVNELRFSNTDVSPIFSLAPATLANPLANLPWIQFGSDINFPSIGVDSAYPQGRSHHAYQIQEALSYAAGRHNIKVGADISYVSIHDTLPLNERGTIFYNEGGNYSSLGNFIADYTGEDPGTISRSSGNPNLNTSATMVSPYVEDAFHLRDNLTINMGLRYEYWGAMANALQYPAMNLAVGFGVPGQTFPDLFSARQVPDKRNFAPRLSLAYTPHWGHFLFGEDKTIIRAGYGVFYDGLFSNIVDQTAES